MRLNDSFNADMCMQAYQAIDHICIHAAVAASMHRSNITCRKLYMLRVAHQCNTTCWKARTQKGRMLKDMCKENAHHTLKDIYKDKTDHMLKDMYKEKEAGARGEEEEEEGGGEEGKEENRRSSPDISPHNPEHSCQGSQRCCCCTWSLHTQHSA